MKLCWSCGVSAEGGGKGGKHALDPEDRTIWPLFNVFLQVVFKAPVAPKVAVAFLSLLKQKQCIS